MPTDSSKSGRPNRPVQRSESVGGRIPPQNLEAEVSVLGALLLDNEAIMKVVDTLNSEDFYRPEHGAG